ncbi:hypothetical protein ASF76_16465 [Microbacterium sp. Leaf151]|nr:hypothetical protein ASF76_16465 [Microbacterium sp. Leaf151]
MRVPIERDVTAVVGANEAGKSQLLLAIKAALSGAPIARADFCRYSELYSVQAGEIRLPEFGGTFTVEDGDTGLAVLDGVREFTLYRPGSQPAFLVINDERVSLSSADLQTLQGHLPTYYELQTDLALPISVSIGQLAGKKATTLQDRSHRSSLFGLLMGFVGGTDATAVGSAVLPQLSSGPRQSAADIQRHHDEYELARTLLVDIAKVDGSTFVDLEEAIAAEREGQVAAIVGGINSAIRENLNIQRWWTQDRDFDLLVEAREHELAFTIQDRTASKYSFGERSQGLRFFLSYFVQLTAHRLRNTVADILLLDEPDAFLSSVGQQDLLRVLHEYAAPENGGPRSQVVYVTHSPFLIDKNAPHRIRVLDKGPDDEGTRVVRDAANNRYEPLRSSLGAYVSETAFIGGRNLLVEGAGDQILIAGMAAHLARRNGSTSGVLDLNAVTVVAAGGADNIPYLAYLARGRDTVKPACVALLDGDESGRRAESVLRRGEARRKRVLQDKYILRLDSWAIGASISGDDGVIVLEIEDLIPVSVAHRAALNYLSRFHDPDAEQLRSFTPGSIADRLADNAGQLWNALASAYEQAFPDEHIEKAGFAREVVFLLDVNPNAEGCDDLRLRFGALLADVADLLDDAFSDEERLRMDDRLKRAVRNFTRNHTDGIKKPDARRLLREIEGALSDSPFGDDLRGRAHAITRDFELGDWAHQTVPRFDEFKERILAFGTSERIAYQDDAAKDPSASLLHTTPSPETSSPARGETGKSRDKKDARNT